MEEANEILNKAIGNKEKVSNSLKPSKVTIKAIEVKTKKSDGLDMIVPLIEFVVKHPDSEDTIKISKVKQLLSDKVFCSNTWFVQDEDANIQKDSPLSRVLTHLKIATLGEAVDKEIETIAESNEKHFLVLKAY
jgi:hypothetical protein